MTDQEWTNGIQEALKPFMDDITVENGRGLMIAYVHDAEDDKEAYKRSAIINGTPNALITCLSLLMKRMAFHHSPSITRMMYTILEIKTDLS